VCPGRDLPVGNQQRTMMEVVDLLGQRVGVGGLAQSVESTPQHCKPKRCLQEKGQSRCPWRNETKCELGACSAVLAVR